MDEAVYNSLMDANEALFNKHNPLDSEAGRLAYREQWEATLHAADMSETDFMDEVIRRIELQREGTA